MTPASHVDELEVVVFAQQLLVAKDVYLDEAVHRLHELQGDELLEVSDRGQGGNSDVSAL